MSTVKSPYWLAALGAAILVTPPYVIYRYQQHAGWSFIPQHHSTIYKVTTSVADVILLPGEILEVIRAIIFSPGGGHSMNDKSILIPLGSWLVWFVVLLPLFKLLQRYRNQPRKRNGKAI